jgi:hypothetical protein
MMQRIEELNRGVWGDKVALSTIAHALGGLGIGLLIDRERAERAKPLAYAFIAFSLLAHLYAFATMTSVPVAVRDRM